MIAPTTAANRRRSGLLVYSRLMIMTCAAYRRAIATFIIEIDKNKKIGNTVDYKHYYNIIIYFQFFIINDKYSPDPCYREKRTNCNVRVCDLILKSRKSFTSHRDDQQY